MGDLKDYRYKELKYFLIANAFIVFFILWLVNGMDTEIKDIDLGFAVFAMSHTVLTFVADFILPESWRNKLYKSTYYGGKIWKDFEENFTDYRLDSAKLRKYIEENYQEKNNREWYSIFHGLLTKGITKVHFLEREYYLCRDMSFSCLIMLMICFFAIILIIVWPWFFGHFPLNYLKSVGIMTILFLIEYWVTRIVTHSAARKFAREVIIEDYLTWQEDAAQNNKNKL